MRKINIYDIDGTICESIFPNLEKDVSILDLKQKILRIELTPGFVKYFFKISKIPGNKIFFLTGRKKVNFYEETLKQLEPLRICTDKIIFYPDNYPYTKFRYSIFKIFNILSISIKNKDSEITIYDDIIDYVPKLLELGLKLKINHLKVEYVKDPFIFWDSKVKKRNKIP